MLLFQLLGKRKPQGVGDGTVRKSVPSTWEMHTAVSILITFAVVHVSYSILAKNLKQ